MYRTIITSAKINFKSLRMSILNYIMLVVIFPLTYLIIAVTSSSGTLPITVQITGIIMSMIFSLFVNMQASLIANSNDITVRETYAVYNIKPAFVFAGQCIFHAVLSLPLILIGSIIIFLENRYISLSALILWLLLTFLFLSLMSILLGVLLNNPHIAGPVINVTYMVIIAVTPIYSTPSAGHSFYLLNPLTHIINLFDSIFHTSAFCSPLVSVCVLAILSVLMLLLIRSILKHRTGAETQNIF